MARPVRKRLREPICQRGEQSQGHRECATEHSSPCPPSPPPPAKPLCTPGQSKDSTGWGPWTVGSRAGAPVTASSTEGGLRAWGGVWTLRNTLAGALSFSRALQDSLMHIGCPKMCARGNSADQEPGLTGVVPVMETDIGTVITQTAGNHRVL